jgi:glycosyltransferase involved in cell wall biosynthesis
MSGISVAIPYFNRSRFIVECVESIRAQTLQPDEIVVVDDGSREEEWEFLRRIPGIRAIRREKNGGAGAARNTAWRATAGPWVAFQDSDDLWDPRKLELQMRYVRRNPEVDGVQTGLKSQYANGFEASWKAKPSPVTLRAALLDNTIGLQTLMIRKSALEAVGGFDEAFRVSDDQDLGVRLALFGLRIHALPEVLATVRRMNQPHLEDNSIRVLNGELAVMRKHQDLYIAQFGRMGLWKHRVRRVADAGRRHGHLVGRAIHAAGWVAASAMDILPTL